MAEAITTTPAADTAAGVLAVARSRRRAADEAEAELLQAAVDWAAMHSTDSIDDAAAIWHPSCGEHGVPIAGEGAPLIAEFSVAEFAAAVGQSTDAGRCYLGEAVELRYRLPRTWARVVAGDLVAWKARRIAKTTMTLTLEAAAFVDRHVAGVAHRIGPAQLDRLVLDAVGWFMPAEAERRRAAAAESRCFEVARNQADLSGLSGTTQVWGTLDVADALDLDAAVTAGAAALKDLGSTDSLDVRRAAALGVIARRQGVLDLTGTDTDTGVEPRSHRPAVRPEAGSGGRALRPPLRGGADR